jgi:hypothetical protein
MEPRPDFRVGVFLRFRRARARVTASVYPLAQMSVFGREAEIKCSIRALPVVTDNGPHGYLARAFSSSNGLRLTAARHFTSSVRIDVTFSLPPLL